MILYKKWTLNAKKKYTQFACYFLPNSNTKSSLLMLFKKIRPFYSKFVHSLLPLLKVNNNNFCYTYIIINDSRNALKNILNVILKKWRFYLFKLKPSTLQLIKIGQPYKWQPFRGNWSLKPTFFSPSKWYIITEICLRCTFNICIIYDRAFSCCNKEYTVTL